MRRFPCWRNECADDVSPYAIFSAVTSDQPHLDEVVEVTSGVRPRLAHTAARGAVRVR